MEVELDTFTDGRPMVLKTNQETALKIKALKSKKQYKEMLDLANSMPNTREKFQRHVIEDLIFLIKRTQVIFST
jgi:hypothetical protein